jgi:hypothetical protein
MIINIAIIPNEHIREVQNLSVKLRQAMEAGEMRLVDQTTKKLLSLTDKEHVLALSEKYWHQLIEQIRRFDGNFESDYIITKPQLEMIMRAGVAESFVDIVSMFEQAMRNECVVLQLPYEDEDEDV